MRKSGLFLVGYLLSGYVYADDDFLITIENKSGSAVRVDVGDLGRYSALNQTEMSPSVKQLEDMESLELSIMSKAYNVGTGSDKIKIRSCDGRTCSELVVEPASLNSKLMHIGQNKLSVNQQLRDTGVGYKFTIPKPSRNTRSSEISSLFKYICSKFTYC